MHLVEKDFDLDEPFGYYVPDRLFTCSETIYRLEKLYNHYWRYCYRHHDGYHYYGYYYHLSFLRRNTRF